VYSALAERFRDDASSQILRYLLDSQDEHALALVRMLVRETPEAKLMLGDALLHRSNLYDDISYGERGHPRPEFEDDLLLSAVIDSANSAIGEWRREPTVKSRFMTRGGRDFEAVAYFSSPRVRAFYEYLARLPEGDNHELGDSAVGEAVFFARSYLAANGDAMWAHEMVGLALDRVSKTRWIGEHTHEELRQWPDDIVRASLLSRMTGASAHGLWIRVFLYYVRKEDAAMLRNAVHEVDDELADQINQLLARVDDTEQEDADATPPRARTSRDD
jgi:hypothetical protein